MNVAYIIAKKYDAIITQMLAKKRAFGLSLHKRDIAFIPPQVNRQHHCRKLSRVGFFFNVRIYIDML